MSYVSIVEHLMSKYGVKVEKHVMYKAKRKEREMVEVCHATCYNKLRKYANIVIEANPMSVINIQVDRQEISQNPVFKRFFLCLTTMRHGFHLGCRLFIGMDRYHLKGPLGGVLLTVVSLDGSNGLLPIAIAIILAFLIPHIDHEFSKSSHRNTAFSNHNVLSS